MRGMGRNKDRGIVFTPKSLEAVARIVEDNPGVSAVPFFGLVEKDGKTRLVISDPPTHQVVARGDKGYQYGLSRDDEALIGNLAAVAGGENKKMVVVGLIRPRGQVDLNRQLKHVAAEGGDVFGLTEGEKLLVRSLAEQVGKPKLVAVAAYNPECGPQMQVSPIEQLALLGFPWLIEPAGPKVVTLGAKRR